MNPTSRAILESVVSTDVSLSQPERGAIQRLLNGLLDVPFMEPRANDEPLLVTQKVAARLLGVSRITIWRLAKEHVLHPVEILPGTWRYAFDEVSRLARSGYAAVGPAVSKSSRRSLAA